jgi:hypothetical protein
VRVDIVDEQAEKGSQVIGRAATNDQFPFAFADAGCATVTVALEDTTLAPGRYRVDFFLGPNYGAAVSAPLNCVSAAPAPGAASSAPGAASSAPAAPSSPPAAPLGTTSACSFGKT